MTVETIPALLQLSDVQLLQRLGSALPTDEDPAGIKDAVTRAHAWLTDNSGQLRASICGSDQLSRIRQLLDEQHTEDAIEIVKAILETELLGFPVITLSVILARNGIDGLCGPAGV